MCRRKTLLIAGLRLLGFLISGCFLSNIMETTVCLSKMTKNRPHVFSLGPTAQERVQYSLPWNMHIQGIQVIERKYMGLTLI